MLQVFLKKYSIALKLIFQFCFESTARKYIAVYGYAGSLAGKYIAVYGYASSLAGKYIAVYGYASSLAGKDEQIHR